jgi:peptidoglycan/LPS O-acetylase OafA/YrhL
MPGPSGRALSNLAPLPADIDHTVAAALRISGLTAWQGLFDHAHLKTGQTVLIHGAAGAVGSIAVQLARELGARVIGTGRAADREAALGLGADAFVDLQADRQEDASEVDVVFDVIGGDSRPHISNTIRLLSLPPAVQKRVGYTNENVTASVLSHLFMLNDLLEGPNLIAVIWTLSYEMVFYLLVTALFTAHLHRRSGWFAVTLACGAVGLGGLLPTAWLSGHTPGPTAVALTADILVIGGLAIAVITRGLPQSIGAWTAGGTGIVLVLFNEHRFGYEGLTILALMFTGTLIYRAQRGQVSRRAAAMVTACVFAAVAAAGAWHIPALTTSSQSALEQREWVMSVVLAGLTFAGGLALQNVRVPSAIAWLGLVSYSVYLVFPLLLDIYDSSPLPASYEREAWLQIGASAVFLVALLGTAAISYRLVEAPMQQLGRRVAARLDGRFGPDRVPAAR